MNKKITSSILAALMIAGSTSFTSFAAMSTGTVVIGNKAFSLEYANDPVNVMEINDEVVAGGKIYIKDFSGNWIENITNKQVAASVIPAVVYKNASGISNFAAADKDQETAILVGEIKALTVANGTKSDKLGLPATVAVTLSDKTTVNANITWDTKSYDGTKAGNITIKGTLTVPTGGTWVLTETQKVVNVMVTINAITTNTGGGGDITPVANVNDLNSANTLTGNYTITSNSATYGPASVNKTVNGNVVVTNPAGENLTLQNLNIIGTLTINYGDGNVVLDNVTVNGVNILNIGNGSLHIKGSTVITTLTVNDANNDAHIVVEGNASVTAVVVNSGSKIEVDENASNPQPFGNVTLSPVDKTSEIVLKGTFETVSVITDAKVVMEENSVITNKIIATAPLDFTVPDTAKVAKVDIQPSSPADVFILSGNLNNVNVGAIAKVEIMSGDVAISSDTDALVNIVANSGSSVSVPIGSAIDLGKTLTGEGKAPAREKSSENAVISVPTDIAFVNSSGTIINLSGGITVKNLLSKIVVSNFAKAKITGSDETPTPIGQNEVIDSTMKLEVTAENKDVRYLAITVNSPAVDVNSVSVKNAITFTFNSDVAGATIKWNGIAISAQSVIGVNTITIPLMVSGVSNTLLVEKLGYTSYSNNAVVWNDSLTFVTSPLSPWEKDRTEPEKWNEDGKWITYSTKTEPANQWYGWHGKKTTTNNAVTDNWKVETEIELTDALLTRNGVRTSMWLNVQDEFGETVDWSILQFKIDKDTGTKGWQYWNGEGKGAWVDIATDIPTTAGVYKLAIYYTDGNIIGYINGVEVFKYAMSESKLTSVKEVIYNSYSFGESYEVKWKVPTVSYANKYPVGAKFISTNEQLTSAINAQADGQTWIIKKGIYDLTRGTAMIKDQSGWYFPITANNLTIIGENNPTISSSTISTNGVWSTQNLITVWGENVKISGVTLKTKEEANKVLEIIGNNFTLDRAIIIPNASKFAGSIYFSNAGVGKTATISNTILNYGRISGLSTATGATVNLNNVDINFAGATDNDPIDNNAEKSYWAYYRDNSSNTAATVNATDLKVTMSNAMGSDLQEAIKMLPTGTTVELAAGTYYVPTNWTVPAGITVDTTTNKAIIEVGTVLVKNEAEFNKALSGDATTIRMAAGNYVFDSQIRITKAINIIGAGDSTVITKGSSAWVNATGSKGYAPLITISGVAGNVLLQGIKVNGAKNITMTPSGTDYGSGINVVSSSNVSLKNITSTNNAAAGLIVNSSTVAAENLNTSGNGWYGVNVDKSDSGNASLTLIGSGVIHETTQIVSDKSTDITVAATGYKAYKIGNTTATIWTNKELENCATITRTVAGTDITTLYKSIEAAVISAQTGDIVDVAAGDYTITKTIDVNKAITIKGAVGFATKITTTGGNSVFNLSALATLEGIYISKTDKSNQALVIISGNDVTIKNSKFIGQYAQGDDEVARAIVPNAGITGYILSGNHFESLRQPAYLEGAGTVINNFVKNTRGWVVCVNHEITFTNNTFDGNAVDIAIIANGQTASTNYTDVVAISQANNGAYVENQLIKASAKNGSLFVKASANINDNSIQNPEKNLIGANGVRE